MALSILAKPCRHYLMGQLEVSVNQNFMELAFEQAANAALRGEVPVGAVIVLERGEDGVPLETPEVVASAGNNRESSKNPLGHAELLAIEAAAQKLGRWRLQGCTLYVTLEPCLMCAGAIILARLDRLVYGTRDPKAGAVDSLYSVLADKRLNHRPQVISGLCGELCSAQLTAFFANRREAKLGPPRGF